MSGTEGKGSLDQADMGDDGGMGREAPPFVEDRAGICGEVVISSFASRSCCELTDLMRLGSSLRKLAWNSLKAASSMALRDCGETAGAEMRERAAGTPSRTNRIGRGSAVAKPTPTLSHQSLPASLCSQIASGVIIGRSPRATP